MKTPLQILNDYYVGKIIVSGVPTGAIGKKIVSVSIDDYEPMLGFIVEQNGKQEFINVLFNWNIEVV